MEIFNFELEQKIDHHSSVEFHSESNGGIFKAQKLNYDSLIALIDLNYLKNENFQVICKRCEWSREAGERAP